MTMDLPQIYLASQSPRRRELLTQIGIRHQILVHDPDHSDDGEVNEDPLPGEEACHYVERLARAKAAAGLRRLQWRDWPARPVLAADTTLVVDGDIIGKPADAPDACRILQRLSNRDHQVLTGVALATPDAITYRLSASRVSFRSLDTADISRYVASGEAADKAGAYGIQGLAALFIREIQGSYSGIMGLPLFETAELLRAAGIDPLAEHDHG